MVILNTTTSSTFLRQFLTATNFLLCLFVVCCFAKQGCALGEEGKDPAENRNNHHHQYHIVQISSLLASNVCNPFAEAPHHKKAASLKVVHRHGPCSHLNKHGENLTPIDHAKILEEDELRVNSIHSQLSKIKSRDLNLQGSKTDSTIPAKSGQTIGSGNYIVTVGLGTPTKQLSLVFDTGSAFTWTQCEPCVRYCYKQKEPIFEPLKSASYANISCNSLLCDALESTTGNVADCTSSTCTYAIQYGDKSFSVGFFSKERLTLTSSDVFDNFYFGCGQYNRGLFKGAAGLLGLSRDGFSLVYQTAKKYGQYFSYCLPSSPSEIGFLSFGYNQGRPRKAIRFTPLSSLTKKTQFYGLDITGIGVGGKRLPIPTSIFSRAVTIIDSGTVVTRLPPTVYDAVRKAFRGLMTDYPAAPSYSILDTCYDFSNYESIFIPTISFFFSGGVEVEVDVSGIFIVVSESQFCLAFAGNGDNQYVGIFGNLQQQTWEVVHDVGRGRVGFNPSAC